MHEHNRYKQYFNLRNMITENEINSCLHLINRIKEHRHDKIKAKQIYKFEHLYFIKHRYHHNFTRGSEDFDNIGQVTLSRHSHLQPSSSSIKSNASGNSTTPAAPMAPTPSVTTPLAHTTPSVAPSQTPTGPSDTCINSTNYTKHKWEINLSNTPILQCKITIGKRSQPCHSTHIPPKEAYITVVEETCS